jgi:hypothetical protein
VYCRYYVKTIVKYILVKDDRIIYMSLGVYKVYVARCIGNLVLCRYDVWKNTLSSLASQDSHMDYFELMYDFMEF